ncbi:PspC domain-containing protein [Streptomyces sp. KM273126]|nr:PspC domain-containing protein [Streptomyces sp. KM273126]
MTDQQHAAPEPGPGSDARRTATEPQDAVPAQDKGGTAPGPGQGKEPRAHGGAHTHAGAVAGAHADAGTPTDQAGPSCEPRNEPTSEPADGPPDRNAVGPAGQARNTDQSSGGTPPTRPTAQVTADGSITPPAPTGFRRDRRHKMLAGVCAGLGRQCDMDPVIFRIVLTVLSVSGGAGLIFYGFVWLFVPYDDEEENEVRKLLTGRVDGQALAAVLFALVGCGVFLTMLGNGGVLTFAVVLALLLAGAGYWSQQRSAPDPDPLAAQAVADAPPEAQAPPVPISYPSWWRDPIVKDGRHVGRTGYLWGPWDARDRDVAAAINIARGTPSRQDIRAAQTPKPRGPRWIGAWVFLLALLAGGLATSLTWDDRALGTSLQAGLACALAVYGLGIGVSAFLGRTGAGSIFLAVVTAGLMVCSAALPADISTHWIRTTWAPTAVAGVQPTYTLGSGVGTLDLTRMDVPKGRTVTTRAEVGVGKLEVVVPSDVTARLTIEVGVGDIQLPGEKKEDVDVAPGKAKQLTLSAEKGDTDDGKSGGTIRVHLQVGMGQAEVTRAAA